MRASFGVGKGDKGAYTNVMRDFFLNYARGYESQDFAHIEQHFAYPCMLSNESGTDLICDADDLQQHIAGFMTQLKDNGLRKAVPTVLHDQRHGAENRVVSVNWKLIGQSEQPFADFDYLYVLIASHNTGDDSGDVGWKISLANLI